MKKLLFFALASLSTTLYPMAPVTRVLVIPVQFRADTKEWYLLLGQDTGSFLGGFRKKLAGETPDEGAIKALVNQTNGVYHEYNFSLENAKKVQTPQGEIIYFVKVPYIPESELKRKGVSERFKSDFAWIKAEDILLSEGDFTPSGKSKPVYRGLVDQLKNYLPEVLHALSAPARTSSTSVQKAVSSSNAISSTPGPTPSLKEYTTLAQFVLDDNPHQPNKKESWAITPAYEEFAMTGHVDGFWIRYDELKNADGSPLTKQQKIDIVHYLKENEHHANEEGLRLANNNLFVLAQGTQNPRLKNNVWLYVHRYMRSQPKLVAELKKKSKN